MNHVNEKDKTRLCVNDWGSGGSVILIRGWPLSADSLDDPAAAKAIRQGKRVACDGAPHGLFVSHKRRPTHDLIDLLGR